MILINSLANIVGKAWAFISIYAFTPIFLKLLGSEAFGFIAFYNILLASVAILDFGLGAVLQKEIPQNGLGSSKSRVLIGACYVFSYLVGGFVCILLYLNSDLLLDYLHLSKTIAPDSYIATIKLLSFAVGAQIPVSICVAILMAQERQVLANKLLITQGVLRTIPALIALYYYQDTAYVYSMMQVVAAAVMLFICQLVLFRKSSPINFQEFSFSELKKIFSSNMKYQLGMCTLGVLSLTNTQIDKAYLTALGGVNQLGYYSIANTIALVPLTLGLPIGMAFFPRLAKLTADKNRSEFSHLYRVAVSVMSLVIFPIMSVSILAADKVLYAWTLNEQVVAAAVRPTILLSLGQALQAITIIPYYVCLAHGKTLPSILTSIGFVLLMFFQLELLAAKSTMDTIAYAFLLSSLFTVPFYLYQIHRVIPSSEFLYWFINAILKPAFISILIIGLATFFINSLHLSTYLGLFVLFVFSMINIIAIIFTNDVLKPYMIKYSKYLFKLV